MNAKNKSTPAYDNTKNEMLPGHKEWACILSGIACSIIVVNNGNHIQFINNAAKQFFGLDFSADPDTLTELTRRISCFREDGTSLAFINIVTSDESACTTICFRDVDTGAERWGAVSVKTVSTSHDTSSYSVITIQETKGAASIEEHLMFSEAERLASFGRWEWDLLGNCVTFSDGWQRIHGTTIRTLSITDLMPIAHPEDLPAIQKAYTDAIQYGIPYSIKHRIIRQDNGVVRWLQAYGEVIRNENGTPVKMLGVSQDITEMLQAEHIMRENEGRLRRMVESLPAGAVYIEDDQIILNQEAEKITGHSHEVKTSLDDWIFVLYGDKSAETRALYEHDKQAGFPYKRIVELPLSHGGFRLVEFTGYIWERGAVWLLNDITDQRRAELEKARYERRIRQMQKLDSLGVMAGGVAHDFNNLLMVVLGNLDLAAKEMPAGSMGFEYLDEAEKAAKRAAELGKLMLTYVGHGRNITKPVDINMIVHEIAGMPRILPSPSILIRYHLHKQLPPIDGDPRQLRQMLINILVNAAESLEGNDNGITISTRVVWLDEEELSHTYLDDGAAVGEYICLEVADSGCGMDEETLNRIFDPFFSTKFQGRGLGLAAALGIIRGHKGTVKIDSSPGKGTIFQIYLPIKKNNNTTNATYPARWSGTGVVLLFEHEAYAFDICQRMLGRMGFSAISVQSVQEAQKTLENDIEELICVMVDADFSPDHTEVLIASIKAEWPDTPLLLISSSSEIHHTKPLKDKQVSGYLSYPFRYDELLSVFREILA